MKECCHPRHLSFCGIILITKQYITETQVLLLSGTKKNDFLQNFLEETRTRALILQNKKESKNDFYVHL